MKFIIILSLLLCSQIAIAAKLKNVKVLKVTTESTQLELKLRASDGPPDSYFYLYIVKEDSESHGKLLHIINKLVKKENYRLDLNIPSFSPAPSGSSYKSIGIQISGETVKK